MAVYRQISITYWQDKDILKLTPEEKFFYIYLLTNSKTKQCGIYELPLQIAQIETGYNRETVIKLIQRFIDHGKIKFDWENEEIFILNWLKHNSFDKNPLVKKCVTKELQDVHNLSMIPDDSPLKPLISPLQAPLQKEKEKEQKEEKEIRTVRGKPTSLQDVLLYFDELKEPTQAEPFFDYFESNGWKVGGKATMRDWKASARNWIRNSKKWSNNGTNQQPTRKSDASTRATFKHSEQSLKDNQDLLESLRERDKQRSGSP